MRLLISKCLFLIVVLNVMATAASDSMITFDEFAKSIRQSVDKNYSIEFIFVFLTIIIVLVVSVVLFEIHRLNKFRQEFMSLAWGKFDSHARSLKLNRENVYILKEIVQEVGLQDPNSIMKSPNVFEKTLEKFYVSRKIENIEDKKLTSIRNLRRALGFLPLSKEIAFISTRQFDHGEKCLVQIPESGPTTNKGMSTVLFTKEKNWSIDRLEGPKVPDGTWIRMNLTRPGDAEYSFRVQVLKDTGEELLLSHAEKLNRAQQRNWVRIDVSIPVDVIYKPSEDVVGDVFSGKLIDMSGGGFGMALPTKLKVGDMLKLSFELPGHGPINDLPVKVVRVAGQYNNNPAETVHSVAFEGDVHLVQEQIIQYVFEKQRQDILTRQI
ncbi:MAG: PilZ domain-containing protein [Fibromonadaceae bacterium]|nr:PilZ domain-containing protein [Fibromonadaceae bacterium]